MNMITSKQLDLLKVGDVMFDAHDNQSFEEGVMVERVRIPMNTAMNLIQLAIGAFYGNKIVYVVEKEDECMVGVCVCDGIAYLWSIT